MTSTATSSAAATTTCGTSIEDLFNCGAGAATSDTGQSFYTLIASIYVTAASFGGQFLLFIILRSRLSRIYRPKTYLVAEKERVPEPPKGLWQWIAPYFMTPDSVLIEKCGLDAYFFLRFLRMLLKIFIPLTCIVLPVLLPINQLSGDGTVKGVDQLGWQNVSAAHTHRLWAHLIMAILAIVWVLYVIYQELRGYIRIRQAYLTSPQHRIRASATTVLVKGIPRKWLSVEALNGLYDVFPGGIRNIWINRNFDDLNEKVKERRKIVKKLESAETDLIRNCVKKHQAAEKEKAKKDGKVKKTKAEKQQERKDADASAERLAQGAGISSGDPHHTPHNIQEALEEIDETEHSNHNTPRKRRDPLFKIGQGLGQGIGAVGHGFGALGQMGKHFVGDVTNDVNRAFRNVNESADNAGFVPDESMYAPPSHTRSDPFVNKPSKTEAAPLHSRPDPYDKSIKTDKSSVSHVQTRRVGNYTADRRRSSSESTMLQGDTNLTTGPESPSVSSESSTPRPTGLRSPDTVDVLEHPPRISVHRPHLDGSTALDESGEGHGKAHLSFEGKITKKPREAWSFLKAKRSAPLPIPFPSPEPQGLEEDEFPLKEIGHPPHADLKENPDQEISQSRTAGFFHKLMFWKKDGEEEEPEVYPEAINEDCAMDEDGEPVWKKYMKPEDRDTLRLPIFGKTWLPSLPLMGKKVDKIYWLRKELARLNVEIEQDQHNPEKFPFMNSAFIQFNHQVAAHMACQALSHHVPQHMAPRLIEISPTDVIWTNMSMKWWDRYLRVGVVFCAVVAMIIFYAIPVTFTGFLSQINYVAKEFTWLHWLASLPKMAKAIIQGILPSALLSLILTLVPITMRLLVRLSGVSTGSARERGVQDYYFTFLFIQVFLVVTLSTGILDTIKNLSSNALGITQSLAGNLPKASNYFMSYLTVQALSNSASALVQVGSLLKWFVWAPMRDSTARQKWQRQTKLNNVKWGSFFPPFTNFAVIGLVFSIIAPLVMVFNLIVFSLYWITQRYNVLYVYQFRNDTGGLLFPKALNQLFVGVYTLEVCLIGLFLLARNSNDQASAVPQAVIMIVVLVATVLFHWLLNDAFKPLFRYLPITLEDDAVVRDAEFERAQDERFERLLAQQNEEDATAAADVQAELEQRERNSLEAEEQAIEEERRRVRVSRQSQMSLRSVSRRDGSPGLMETKPSKPWTGDRWKQLAALQQPVQQLRHVGKRRRPTTRSTANVNPQKTPVDEESQKAVGDVLFGGFSDELEDLTPEERDVLIRYSFQHSALRARRPVVWIPGDALGVSDDEIQRCKAMSTVEYVDPETEKREPKTNIWMSNEGTALDGKGRVVFRRSPPDFANVDLIAL